MIPMLRVMARKPSNSVALSGCQFANEIVAAEDSPPSSSRYALLRTYIDKRVKKWYSVLFIIDNVYTLCVDYLFVSSTIRWMTQSSIS